MYIHSKEWLFGQGTNILISKCVLGLRQGAQKRRQYNGQQRKHTVGQQAAKQSRHLLSDVSVWRPSVCDSIDNGPPFSWMFLLRDISEWLA